MLPVDAVKSHCRRIYVQCVNVGCAEKQFDRITAVATQGLILIGKFEVEIPNDNTASRR